MPRTALTPEEIAAFRKKAARVATKLFAEQGYDGVTMRAIAKQLGVSAMAPYRYFAGKEEIFALVRAEAARRFSDALDKQFHSTSDPLERALRLRNAYVQFALRHSDQYRIIFEVRTSNDGPFAGLDAEVQRATDVTIDAVRGLIDAGLIQGDPRMIAHHLWAYVHGLVHLHLAGRLSDPSLQQLLDAAQPGSLGAKR
jgi:AcrR family transcriptional regulator